MCRVSFMLFYSPTTEYHAEAIIYKYAKYAIYKYAKYAIIFAYDQKLIQSFFIPLQGT